MDRILFSSASQVEFEVSGWSGTSVKIRTGCQRNHYQGFLWASFEKVRSIIRKGVGVWRKQNTPEGLSQVRLGQCLQIRNYSHGQFPWSRGTLSGSGHVYLLLGHQSQWRPSWPQTPDQATVPPPPCLGGCPSSRDSAGPGSALLEQQGYLCRLNIENIITLLIMKEGVTDKGRTHITQSSQPSANMGCPRIKNKTKNTKFG